MKVHDLGIIAFIILLFTPFILSKTAFDAYETFNHNHGMVTSFVKFAILATLGESIGLRITKGVYNQSGYGLLPRAIVWGILGLTIAMAFQIFSKGTPVFLEYMGINDAEKTMADNFGIKKLLVAFSISTTMNLIYAPVMMTIHKITDVHIITNGGTIAGLFKPIKFGQIIANLNWTVHYNFVFKKTIPFFWIPAHTLTFLLPADYRVLFAAVLGIMLGVLLAIASLKSIK